MGMKEAQRGQKLQNGFGFGLAFTILGYSFVSSTNYIF